MIGFNTSRTLINHACSRHDIYIDRQDLLGRFVNCQ